MGDPNRAIIEADTQLQGDWEPVEVKCPYCYQSEFTYLFEDAKSMYCLNCTEEFDASDVDFKQGLMDGTIKKIIGSETVEKKPVNSSVLPEKTHFVTSYAPKCGRHKPTMVIDGGDWSVWGGTKEKSLSTMNDFDIVLNLSGNSAQWKHSIPLTGLKKYETTNTFTECMLDWPDYSVPDLERNFWVDLIKYAKKKKLKVLAVCVGGHGRTGTALAAMQTVALGWTAKKAIDWIRDNYCEEAIESNVQEEYIKYVAGEIPAMPEPGSKDPSSWVGSGISSGSGYLFSGAWDKR